MYLRGIQVLKTHRSGVERTDGRDGIGFNTPEQVFQKVVELEYLIRRARDVGTLRVRIRVVGSSIDTHSEVMNDLVHKEE